MPEQQASSLSGTSDLTGPLRLGQLMLVAAAAGLSAGYVELAMVAIDWFGFGRHSTRSPDTIWMTPLGYLALALAAALLLVLLYASRGGRVPDRLAWWTLSWLAGLSALLTYYPRLSLLSLVILAAGLATTCARLAGRNPAAARRGAARLAVALGALMVVSGGGLQAYRGTREALTERALPQPRQGAPNVLLIVLDAVRAQNLSLYGYTEPTTPQLQRFATHGVRYDLAVSTAPWTTPSHATMFTGRYLPQHGADWRSDMVDSLPTVAGVLAAHGYRTGGFSANKIHAGSGFGFARGFQHFEDFMVSPGEVANSTSLVRFFSTQRRYRRLVDSRELLGRKTADDVNQSLLRWVRGRRDRPFFAFLNYYDAHQPYLPPEPFAGEFGASRVPASLRQRIRGFLRPGYWPKPSMKAYDGAIAYIDDRLGLLFAALEREGELANTVVIITADHGEEFGEHGLWGHGDNLYFPNLHVPLLIVYPGVAPAGDIVTAPVSLRDIPATIVDLAGLGADHPFPGRSLAGWWRPAAAGTAETPLSEVSGLKEKPPQSAISRGDMVSLVRDSLHLIRNGDGVEELYDLRRDPAARSDLWTAVPGDLKATLDHLLDSLASARSR